MIWGIILPKSEQLNWWPIWKTKNWSKKEKENTIKTRSKAN